MIYDLVFFLFLISTSYECEILKASQCPPGPTKDDEELMKSELYTKEQLFAFCDAGKTHADCINERLHCCDMRVEYASALVSLDAQLKRNAWRTGKYCAGISESNVIQYKCLTTSESALTTTLRSSTTPIPICDVEQAGRECSPIIEHRVHFESQWTVYEKAKWCKDTYDYYTCALRHITNCTTAPVATDIAQLTLFMDFVEKTANRECPGGLYGCAVNAESDMRCRAGAKKSQRYSLAKQYSQFINGCSVSFFAIAKKINNHITLNFTHSYMRNRTTMENEQNIPEYCRYRNATYQTSTKMSIARKSKILSLCCSSMTHPNENDYSKHRNSLSSRKKSLDEGQHVHLKPHETCRSLSYDKDNQRFPVPDNKVGWHTIFPDYTPFEYTTEKIRHNPKADPVDPLDRKSINLINLIRKSDRRSFTGHYYVDPISNRPRNPNGRTGITGRGRLYYWGPNHAGDPVVTRWLRDKNGSIVYRRAHSYDRLKPVLEFVAILRQDRKQWALPGGMVDPGEQVSETVKREFQEEAVRDGVNKNDLDQLFSNGYKLFESYVDDPRNTDNAWIETVAVNFHDETGQLTKNLRLNAGDDAEKVAWCSIDRKLELYACHKEIVKAVVDRLDAYW